ncbi:hypothetical protein ILUMI_13982 [Ignelater luminosus]|uniref:DUF5641 domain-containing protein n=1 Tax=Ignelater luminosus TaxID=2038154 RepID=A0A8K0CV45_IGNLU|nr:hypothetical protein ILUMI_13982 [Ignelater luminosus]
MFHFSFASQLRVSDLSTDAFIACLRRFIARRSKPEKIFLDNAKNFIGANRELRSIVQQLNLDSDKIINGSMASEEPALVHVPTNRLSNFQRLQHLLQHFWTRWQLEYLHSLQQRRKWLCTRENIKPGLMVLLKNENGPPLTWSIGQVVEVFPGVDGVVRVVQIKTAKCREQSVSSSLRIRLCSITNTSLQI